jgi:hypothetical protein
MNKAVRMMLALSLLLMASLPAFALNCKYCSEDGCVGAPEVTNTRCTLVQDPADCREFSVPTCNPTLGGIALLGELSVVSVEMTRPSERVTIVSNYQPVVPELPAAADAPQN